MAAHFSQSGWALDRLLGHSDLPRTLIVAAHPDDEVIGAGSRLGRFASFGLIEVTDGAPRDLADAHSHGFSTWIEYAGARRAELEAALNLAGANPRPWTCLGIPDQQAAFHLRQIIQQIAAVIDRFRPELILTHPYEGGHPDHDACAFAVPAAVQMCDQQPQIAEFASYHLAAESVRTGTFLRNGEPGRKPHMSRADGDLKRRMFECFTTQHETLRMFDPTVEAYRYAPRYRFDKPPHAGTLHYEQYPWGMTGAQFCELVQLCGVTVCA